MFLFLLKSFERENLCVLVCFLEVAGAKTCDGEDCTEGRKTNERKPEKTETNINN